MKYLIVTEDYDIFWTDDKKAALKVADTFQVYDMETKKMIDEDEDVVVDHKGQEAEIKEWKDQE